jgi:hypothetical protein
MSGHIIMSWPFTVRTVNSGGAPYWDDYQLHSCGKKWVLNFCNDQKGRMIVLYKAL